MPIPPYPIGKIGLWRSPRRCQVAQRKRLNRFLLESAFFDAKVLQAEWREITRVTVFPRTEAMQAGWRGRYWTTEHDKTDSKWRYPTPPVPPRRRGARPSRDRFAVTLPSGEVRLDLPMKMTRAELPLLTEAILERWAERNP